jgi:hypothetical protein
MWEFWSSLGFIEAFQVWESEATLARKDRFATIRPALTVNRRAEG